jgi:hypothetical protein
LQKNGQVSVLLSDELPDFLQENQQALESSEFGSLCFSNTDKHLENLKAHKKFAFGLQGLLMGIRNHRYQAFGEQGSSSNNSISHKSKYTKRASEDMQTAHNPKITIPPHPKLK